MVLYDSKNMASGSITFETQFIFIPEPENTKSPKNHAQNIISLWKGNSAVLASKD